MLAQSFQLEQKIPKEGSIEGLLQQYVVAFKTIDRYYLQVGEITPVQGWILHISVIEAQFNELLSSLLPVLIQQKVPFKIIHNVQTASSVLNGFLGYAQLGKVIKVYPENNFQAVSLAQRLVTMTSPFRGPEIPTDAYLGGTVYTRYGSFNPIVQKNAQGKEERFIHDYQGKLIRDECAVPFKLPTQISWPFKAISEPKPAKINGYLSVLNDTYVITSVIKGDAKGNVMLTLRMHGWGFQSCLVKEGRHDTGVDEAGRDIRERLRWQYRLQKSLHGILPVPKVYELFEQNGNVYLAMEFIKGKSLYEVITEIFSGCNWLDLLTTQKLRLIDYLIELIGLMEILHREGYVHRDFIPDNFIIDRGGRMRMVDLEMTYSINGEYPTPPFALGTIGFMSPEQMLISIPTVKEDIYALGAMMIILLTGLTPEKFEPIMPNILRPGLSNFLGNETMAILIEQCLHSDSDVRPSLDAIKVQVSKYRDNLQKQSITQGASLYSAPNQDELRHLIHDSTLALDSSILSGPKKRWFSNLIDEEKHILNQQNSSNYYMGLYAGISGVIYVLSKAKSVDLLPLELSTIILNNYEYIQREFLSTIPTAPSGYYFGTAGLITGLVSACQNNIIEFQSDNLITLILSCLDKPTEDLSLAIGIAGQGLSTLQCMSYLPAKESKRLLGNQVSKILALQEKDGSWMVNGYKATGISYGTSGILLFLMAYNGHTYDDQTQKSIEKGLYWLRKKAIRQNNKFIWPLNSKQQLANPWLFDGYLGVALCLLKAYEILKDDVYKQMAEGALFNFHPHTLDNNFSLAWGLSGLGEVYLEATRSLNDEQWQERADWIAHVFNDTGNQSVSGSRHWVVENLKNTTADLMIGNGGIIHYLLRYHAPERLGFPLLQ